MPRIKEVMEVAHHRNGVSGEPYHAVRFRSSDQANLELVAVVFDRPGAVAVLDGGLLSGLNATVKEFGMNAFRGDRFEKELRAVIAGYEAAR